MLLFPCHQKRDPAYFHPGFSGQRRTDHEHVYKIPFSFIPDGPLSPFMQRQTFVYQCAFDYLEGAGIRGVVEVSHSYDMFIFKRIAEFLQGGHGCFATSFRLFFAAIFRRMVIHYKIEPGAVCKAHSGMQNIPCRKLLTVRFRGLQ